MKLTAAGLGYTASMVMGDTSKLAAASAETHGRAPRSEFAAHCSRYTMHVYISCWFASLGITIDIDPT